MVHPKNKGSMKDSKDPGHRECMFEREARRAQEHWEPQVAKGDC